jgi:hypothetical protein
LTRIKNKQNLFLIGMPAALPAFLLFDPTQTFFNSTLTGKAACLPVFA